MKKVSILFLCCLLFSSCIDRINIEVPDSYSSQLVVDGVITDEPGPYTINLSLASRIEGFLPFRKLVSADKVTLFDNAGNSEVLEETERGIYQTKPDGIQGMVGREYHIEIEWDGKVYESLPDMMSPAGNVDSIYYELESFQPVDAPTRYGFRVYTDAQGVPDSDNLFRWKHTGTFVIFTQPEIHRSPRDCSLDIRPCAYNDPYGGCTCCQCWVTQYDEKPYVSDNQFIIGGKFKRIEAGFVSIEYYPFQITYRMEVKQMSLSRVAFDYWKTLQTQKEGANSLFQPPTGKTRTNIFAKDGSAEAQGIFYASAVKLKQLYLTNADLKVTLAVPKAACDPPGIIAEDCRLAYRYSSTKPPTDWK
jgi:Domain of unknown function (DUF4249)